MPTTEDPTINAKQRAALYELVCNHLAGIDELWLALGQERDYGSAAQLGRAYRADLRLLDDIGWDPQEAGERFALTMTADELVPLLQRLREEARGLLAGDSNRSSREEDEEQPGRTRFSGSCGAGTAPARHTCSRALGPLP